MSRPDSQLAEVERIVLQAKLLAAVHNSDYDDETGTRRRLNEHGIPDDEIAKQLATLSSNTSGSTAVLTSYSLLHSLQHLDTILEESPRLSYAAEAVIALFRCAEVCLYDIGVLSSKMVASLERGDLQRAVSAAHWRRGLQELLYRLSALVVEVSEDPAAGLRLDIADSAIHRECERRVVELRDFLRTRWPEADADVFSKDLDDPRRFIFFNEFINTSDERVWRSRMARVRVAGAAIEGDETPAEAYRRIVRSDEIEAMMLALETEADTDLMSFRVVHQVTEIIANCVNASCCEAIALVLSDEPGAMDGALRRLVVSNRLLSVVDESVKLMMRALTPRAYSEIRPNLGMVQGTSSVALRKRLFNTTYPLLVRALKLRLCGLESALADDPEEVEARARAALESGEDPRLVELTRQIIVLHQHVRTWRDNHQQLPKTHLGVSADHHRPTVSLSGSDGAVGIAHELRKVHAADPIEPLYRALVGTPPPAVHELLTPGGFDEYMAHTTARAVHETYAEVQERFYQRVERQGGRRGH
ncbi:MAG: hypothetical protein R3190_01345 [Thermoanaerobaculia bacterium]|nr:hypothetical protein [Thermoanaerobaculia bacterium]